MRIVDMSESGWDGDCRVSPVYRCIFTGIFIHQNIFNTLSAMCTYMVHGELS